MPTEIHFAGEKRWLALRQDFSPVGARAVGYLLLLRPAADRKQKLGPAEEEPVTWLNVRGSVGLRLI